MRYSLFQNIKYVYKKAFHANKHFRFKLTLLIISSILIPIIASVIPAVAVEFITGDYNISLFILVVGVIFLIYSILLFIKLYLEKVISCDNLVTRLKEFVYSINYKLMNTDYINVEPQEKQNRIHKALMPLNSNWVGIELMLKNTPTLIINMLGLIIYSFLISSLNIIIIIVLVLMSLLNYFLNMYAQKYEEKHKIDYAKLDRKIGYLYKNSISLTNGKDVRIYKMKKWFHQIFYGLIKKRSNWSKKIEYRYFLPAISDNILLFIRDIIAYSMLINLVLNKEISIVTFTLYIGFIAGFSVWLYNSVTALSNLKRASLGVNDYRNYMEIEEVFNHSKGCDIPREEELPLEIEFKDVSFHYPGTNINTLSHLNFKIEKGSKVALVGNNGAGKTTLVKLLTGLYYPTEGQILVNGKSLVEYNLVEYQALVGAVFQDVETLAFTIAKNIAIQKEYQINYEKVWRSLELAGLKEKVDSLKNKEQTFLTQYLDKDGILLSGGEMQKLMLARALYKDAPFIVLDEPTAALDPIAEAELYEKYNDLTKEKTTLFISHRLSSTQFCDRILFLDDGSIVEDGTHEELVKLNGKYAYMFSIQSHYYKENLEEIADE